MVVFYSLDNTLELFSYIEFGLEIEDEGTFR